MFCTIYFYVKLDLFICVDRNVERKGVVCFDMFTHEFISSPTRDVLASWLSRQ